VLFYFITFTPKWCALAVAAINAKLRAILLYKICKIVQFLCRFVNSVHDSQFCTHCSILCKILRAQNHRILTYLGFTIRKSTRNITTGYKTRKMTEEKMAKQYE